MNVPPFPIVILAGGQTVPTDPLYAYTRGQPKALLEIAGKPMITWVAAALQSCDLTGETAIVGLPPGAQLDTPRPLHFIADQGSLISNALAGLRWASERQQGATHVILSTTDIPLITPEIVAQFIHRCQPLDKALYYPIVSWQSMEARFPGSQRTYSRFVEGEFAGGDLVLAETRLLHTNVDLWQTVTAARKYPWKMARVIGFSILLKLLCRRLRIADVEQKAAKLIGLPVAAIPFDRAEIAMDVDKPHQFDALRQILASGQHN